MTEQSIVIQAGGKSSRMGGQDKGFIPFQGRFLIEHVISRILCNFMADQTDLIIITNQPEKYRSLQNDYPIRVTLDIFPGRGALGGMYSAMYYASTSLVGVVACDMPFINGDILIDGFNFLSKTAFDAYVPKTDKGYEPFHAVYRREPCISAIYRALESGTQKVISWFNLINIYPLEIHNQGILTSIWFYNINTFEDLEKGEKITSK